MLSCSDKDTSGVLMFAKNEETKLLTAPQAHFSKIVSIIDLNDY